MQDQTPRRAQLEPPSLGPALVDRRAWPCVVLRGNEAIGWAQDLLTADVARLAPGEATRSLLLTPTGRIRADVHVYRVDDGLVIAQDPRQPRPVGDLLAPYVLSSDVRIEPWDRGPLVHIELDPSGGFRPSILERTDAVDLLRPPGDPLPGSLRVVSEEEVDVARVRAGTPRFGADLTEESLPAEAGLDAPDLGVIDTEKGCYLGQESVAKVRTRGRPPKRLLVVETSGEVASGDLVAADGREVGVVTSAAARDDGGTTAIVRVASSASDAALTVRDSPLVRR